MKAKQNECLSLIVVISSGFFLPSVAWHFLQDGELISVLLIIYKPHVTVNRQQGDNGNYITIWNIVTM